MKTPLARRKYLLRLTLLTLVTILAGAIPVFAIEPDVVIEPRIERSQEPYRHWLVTLKDVIPDSPATKETETPADLMLHLWSRGDKVVQFAARSPNAHSWRDFDVRRLKAADGSLTGQVRFFGHTVGSHYDGAWPGLRIDLDLSLVVDNTTRVRGTVDGRLGFATGTAAHVTNWRKERYSEFAARRERIFDDSATPIKQQVTGMVLDGAAERQANAFADNAEWPQWLGPHSSLRGQAPDRPMVTDVSDTRLLWKAEAHLGPGKAQVTRYGSFGNHYRVPSSGASSPVLADGKVYLYWYQPAGEPYIKGEEEKRSPTGYFMKSMWQTQADDHVGCFDACTGQRLWEAVFPLGGRTFQLGKSNLINSTVAVADGVVVAVGGAGRVYCLDANSGQQRWQAFLPSHADWTEKAAAGAGEGGRARPHAVTICAGKAVVADERGGLIAFDLADGGLAWHAKGVLGLQATPNVWTAGDVALVLAQNDDGVLHAISADSGTVAWKIEDLPEHPYKTASNFLMGDILLLQSRAAPDAPQHEGRAIGGYRVSARGAEKVWELSGERYCWPICGGNGTIAAIGEHRAIISMGPHHRKQSGEPYSIIVDVRDGKVVQENLKADKPGERGGLFVSCGDRLIAHNDVAHCTQAYHGYQITDNGLKLLWHDGHFGHMEATSYEVPLVNPFVDGRLIVRGAFGLYCYDLRSDR